MAKQLPLGANGQPRSKLSMVQEHYAAGRYRQALAIAAKFPQLGKEADAIRLGHEAFVHPDFYRQLHKDVAGLQQAGIAALAAKYKFA